jgi:adenylate kinase
MIVFFGPTGSGKSMQGQIMAARHGWRWVSAGEVLRQTNDPQAADIMKAGKLVPDSITDKLVLAEIDDDDKVILDGYPRTVDQAKMLVSRPDIKLSVAIVLDLDPAEIQKRLALRQRAEDTPETIAQRIELYNSTTKPILDCLNEHGVIVEHVDGSGLVGAIHDRIEAVLEKHKVIGSF